MKKRHCKNTTLITC